MRERRVGLLVTLALLLGIAPPAILASEYPAPVIHVQDAPVTRNRTVKLSVVQPGGYGITEYRISNDGTTSAGMLANYVSVGERNDWYSPTSDPRHYKLDWVLPDVDGPQRVYAQVHYLTGSWSDIVHLDLTLDRSGSTSLYIDADRSIENPLALWPTTDFHTRSATPARPIYATTGSSAKGTSLTVTDDTWAVTFTYAGAIQAGEYAVRNPGDGPCTDACTVIAYLLPYQDQCTVTSGTFNIRDVSFEPSGDLLTMTADFRLGCSYVPISGSIRYGSGSSVVALDQDADLFDFGTLHVGQASATRTVTFTNFGDTAATLGTAVFLGAAAVDYEKTADTCSSATLAVNGTCSVTIRLTPSERGYRRASLSIPDGTARGSRKVALEAIGVIATTLELTAPIVPDHAGPARFVITITPPPACGPELFIDGREYPSYTVRLRSDPDRVDHIFDISVLTTGSHRVEARYDECGFYLASGPVTMDVTVGSDVTPPTGSVDINYGDEYTNSASVILDTLADDAASDMGQIALSNDGVNWTVSTYLSWKAWTLAGTPGVNTVYAKFADEPGNWSDVVSDTIIFDGAPPIVTPPTQEFVAGTSIQDGKVVVRVPWSGDDAVSGIADYDLNQRTDTGAWKDVPLAAGVTASSGGPAVNRRLAPGRTHTFRVRAMDAATNGSGWTQGPQLKLKKIQEANSRLRYQGTWKSVSSSAYWGGGAKKSGRAGATASLTFTGRSFGWVSRTGPDRGLARVYVNGTFVDTVDLYSPSAGSKRVVWERNWDTTASRTVMIYVLGTPGRPRVDIDAFLTAE